MGIPKTGSKIMSNNIREKSEMSPPHSKVKAPKLKSSGQELDPYPQVMKKKVKKKKKKDPISSLTQDLLAHKAEIRGFN
jgi:hypothetical protein